MSADNLGQYRLVPDVECAADKDCVRYWKSLPGDFRPFAPAFQTVDCVAWFWAGERFTTFQVSAIVVCIQ